MGSWSVYSNTIGLNAAATLQNGADNNYIGDTASGNLISGNAVWGLEISSNGNIVLARPDGTNGTGLLALGHAVFGGAAQSSTSLAIPAAAM